MSEVRSFQGSERQIDSNPRHSDLSIALNEPDKNCVGIPSQAHWLELPDQTGTKKRLPRKWRGAIAVILAVVVAVLIAIAPVIAAGLLGGIVQLFIQGFLERLGSPAPQATAKDLLLLEDPDDPEVCLVDLEIFQDYRITGKDRGAAWHQDGCVLFAGRLTSFCIGGDDVLRSVAGDGFSRKDPLTNRLLMQIEDQIPLRHPTKLVAIRFKPVDRNGEEYRSSIPFMKNVREFVRKPPKASRERQYPPLTPGPRT